MSMSRLDYVALVYSDQVPAASWECFSEGRPVSWIRA